MFKPVGASSVKEYINALEPGRREQILFLDNLIKKTTPKLKPHFAYNMLGYGTFKYLNFKKQEIDWPVIALASQKNYISIYICSLEHGEYIAEKYKDKLGGVSVGKSCIRFKDVKDLNLEEFKKIIKKTEVHPGLNFQ